MALKRVQAEVFETSDGLQFLDHERAVDHEVCLALRRLKYPNEGHEVAMEIRCWIVKNRLDILEALRNVEE